MQVTRNQFLIFVLALVISIASWFGSLYLFMQLSLDAKWIAFYLFFGSCLFACLIGWNIERILKICKKRHATKRRNRLASFNAFRKLKRGIHVDPPSTMLFPNTAFAPQQLGQTYMQKKLEELKNLAVKGVNHD